MNTYLLYDPALNGAYTQLILQQHFPMHGSLFAGTKDERLDDVAPYIFQVDETFAQKILSQPLVELKAVVFVLADGNLQAVSAHFRPFIYQNIKGREFFFRFWDARVLAKFLPTCSRDQVRTIFESLDALILPQEADPADAVRYGHDQGRLLSSRISLDIIIGRQDEQMAKEQKASDVDGNPEQQESQHLRKRRTFLS